MKKPRKAGKILLDLEPLLLELVDHDLQMGDILNLIRGYLEIHAPGCVEEYLDGGRPVFFYGHSEDK